MTSSIRRTIQKGASASFFVQGIGTGLGFLLQYILAHHMTLRDFGIYVFVMTWVNLLVIPGGAALGKSAVKFIPQYSVRGEMDKLASFVGWSVTTVFWLSGAIAILAILLCLLLPFDIPWQERVAFAIGMASLPFLCETQLFAGFFRGLKKILISGIIYNNVIKLVSLGLAIGAVGVVGVLSPSLMLVLALIATVIGTAAAVIVFGRVVPFQSKWKFFPTLTSYREWLSVSAPLLLFAIVTTGLARLDVLVLGSLGRIDEVGPYGIAIRIAGLTQLSLVAVSAILGPLMAEAYAENNRRKLQYILRIAALINAFTFAIPCVLLVFWGQTVLGLFGQVYASAYAELVVLIAGQMVNAIAGPTALLLIMTRYQWQMTGIFGASAVLNLVLILSLVPQLGMFGAAIATTSSIAFANLAALVMISLKLKVNPTLFQRYWKRLSASQVGI